MFKTARLQLTAWYVLILAVITLAFSFTIYRSLSLEIDRFAKNQRLRIERRFEDRIPPEIIKNFPPPPNFTDPDIVKETKTRIIYLLFILDSIIIFVCGILSYFLSGLTLKPIKQMVEEQDRFISDASHELRTPLTALQTSIEVALKDPNLSLVDAKKTLRGNLQDTSNLSTLTTSLLELSRFQKKAVTLNLSDQSVKNLISRSVTNIRSKLKQKNISLTFKSGNTKIKVDEGKIVELITILLDNAIKYSPPKSKITVGTSKNKSNLLIYIKDQGMGIEESELPKIFDRFYRSDKARSKANAEGFGLGLSIAKSIIESHRGSLTVESKPGFGSTFKIRLPLRQKFS